MTTPGPSRSSASEVRHEPVLAAEVVSFLRPRPEGLYVDATVGLGGHAAALIAAGAKRLIGIDRDAEALTEARVRLAAAGTAEVDLVHADYRDLARVLADRGVASVDGIVVDFGVSSVQLDEPARGFSFRTAGPLDMRMDRSAGPTAADLVATVDEATLADVIWRFGEERHARRIARAIVRARSRQALTDTGTLASVVRAAAGGRGRQRIDPATRTFQALRIWVNRELDGLDRFLDEAVGATGPGARLAVIAFHSLEDRVVKHTFRRQAAEGTVRLLTKKPVVPDDAEIRRNPRARSARLRVVEKAA
ncbi:MAG: 16S rRNA (cytosine(1402)-N(4))-methyltransferase RsmH [Vicinamibacterales bacterium]